MYDNLASVSVCLVGVAAACRGVFVMGGGSGDCGMLTLDFVFFFPLLCSVGILCVPFACICDLCICLRIFKRGFRFMTPWIVIRQGTQGVVI